MIAGEEMVPMHPWWRGFIGEIKPTAKHKYDVIGVVNKVNATTVEIRELPIHKWTTAYKVELEAMIAGKDNEPGTIKVCLFTCFALLVTFAHPLCRSIKSTTTTRMCTL
jgi:DNA topoisomerase-2